MLDRERMVNYAKARVAQQHQSVDQQIGFSDKRQVLDSLIQKAIGLLTILWCSVPLPRQDIKA